MRNLTLRRETLHFGFSLDRRGRGLQPRRSRKRADAFLVEQGAA
jgi:hypothetical protein